MPRNNKRTADGRYVTPIPSAASLMESEIIPTPLSHTLPQTPVLNLHLEQYENIFVTPKGPIVPLPGTPETPTLRRVCDTPYRRNTPPSIEYKADSPPALVPASAPTVVDLSVSPLSPKSDGYAEISSSESSAEKQNDPFAVPGLRRRSSGSLYYNSKRTFHNAADLQMVKYYKQGLFNSMLPMDPDYDTICFTITSRHRNLADIALRSTLDYKLLLEWNKGLLGTPERPLTRSSKLRAGVQIWTPIPARFEDWVKSKQMHDMLVLPPV